MKSHLCSEIQASFPSYLDGAISGRRMQEIAAILSSAATVPATSRARASLQATLASMGSPKRPPTSA